jgi:hypothetical protein
MAKRYPLDHVLTMLALLIVIVSAGCASLGIGQPTATPIPFNLYTAEDVLDAFSRSGLPVPSAQRDMLVGRGSPSGFADRYTFVVERIAPSGGQFLVFDDPAGLDEWRAYISQLRASDATRRDVTYVFEVGNVLLQLNANLTPQEAQAFRDALGTM